MLSNTPGNDIGEVMAVCEPRLKECQELPEHRRIPRGHARQQRVERPDPGSQTGLPSNPDCATSQIRGFGFVARHLSLSPHKNNRLGVGTMPISRESGSLR